MSFEPSREARPIVAEWRGDRQVPTIACPTDEVLTAFLLGDLPEPAIAAVREHQEVCPLCESRARRLEDRSDWILEELRRTALRMRGDDLAAPAAPLILPGYDVEETPVGIGGMGVVHRARHRELDRVVAIKMIAGHSEEVSRLLRIEAKAVARLQHPNIVQIFDIGQSGGRPFLVMELVEGGSLAQKIDEEPPSPRWAAEMVQTLALAVDHAHNQGIVHCDLKPSNILLTDEGIPKIADFGVAKWNESDAFWGGDGPRRGTPGYMAPEQVDRSAERIGPPADIYALGGILYELLAGRVPHLGESAAETLRMVREEPPPPPSRWRSDIPGPLDAIVLKCLRKEPAQRYGDARALADDLGRFLDEDPGARPGRWTKRRPVPLAAPLLMLMLAGLSLVAFGVSPLDAPTLEPFPAPRPVSVPESDPESDPDPEPEGPPIVEPEIQGDGSIRLGAAAASVLGPSLRFEHSFGNLGFWHHEDDRAFWVFRIDEPGRFRLSLEYANNNGNAGNVFEIEVDGGVFTAQAVGTNNWAAYWKFPIAELDLPAGVHRIEIRPKPPLVGALFDVRAIIFERL